MARKPGTKSVGEYVLFDVVYEDGTQRSNRRVPGAALGGLDGDEPAKASSKRRTARSPRNPACRRRASRACAVAVPRRARKRRRK